MKTAGRAEEMKEGSSLPKCLGLLKTRGYKEDNETLLGDLEAMAGYRGHGHGLEEAHMEPCFFFFSTPTVLQAWILLTLCFPSTLKAQAGTASVSLRGPPGRGTTSSEVACKTAQPRHWPGFLSSVEPTPLIRS